MGQWTKLLAWAGGWIIAGLIPIAIGWSYLPDPTATHWGPDGVPDGNMPLAVVPLLSVLIVGVGLLATSLFRWEGRPTAEAVAMVGLMGAIGVSLQTSLVVLNWDAPTWSEAATFDWFHIVAVVVLGGVGVLVGYQVGKRWYPPPIRDDDASTRAVIDVADGEVVSWTGKTTVWWPLALVGGFGFVFLVMPGWWKLIGVLFFALAFLFSAVYVSVDDRGLEVRLGGRLRAKRIPLSEMARVDVIDLEPARWGGWGYRVAPGRSAIVLRRGDAIEVTFPNDRQFAVTVDDAATGAALLNGLLARLARTGEAGLDQS